MLPPGFSWLSPACRPTPDEVLTYAHLINEVEHRSPAEIDDCLREAELQLWIWRNEARKRAPRRRRARATVVEDGVHAAIARWPAE
jgi:hypothetical protein